MSKGEKMSLEQEGDPRFDGYVPPTLFHNLGLSELGEPGGGGHAPLSNFGRSKWGGQIIPTT